jgi:hypothetical protein
MLRDLSQITSAPWCVIKVLLEKGVHKRDEEGAMNMLKDARRKKRQDVVALFLEYGVTIPASNSNS